MPTPRGELSASVVDGKIYAFGGFDYIGNNAMVLSTVEMYNPQTDTWTRRADVPTPRTFMSVSPVNEKIYAIGGAWIAKIGDVGQAFSTVEVYDPVADTWARAADRPTPRWAFSTVVVARKIYAIGGTRPIEGKWTSVSKVEVYEPATNRWTSEADMPTSRGWLSGSAVGGKIYAIGGAPAAGPPLHGGSALATVEEYDTGFVPPPVVSVEAKGELQTLWDMLKVW